MVSLFIVLKRKNVLYMVSSLIVANTIVGEDISAIADKTDFSQSTVCRRVKLLELDADKLKKAAEWQVSLANSFCNYIIEQDGKIVYIGGNGNDYTVPAVGDYRIALKTYGSNGTSSTIGSCTVTAEIKISK